MKNSTRNFVKIIKEICSEEGISVRSFSYDWIFRLCKNSRFNYIIGYQFGLNVSSVQSICCDKSAASEIMSSFDIPNVEHYFFMSPANQKYISDIGNWDALTEKLIEYGQLVCKANEGSGGNQVYLVNNQYELENATYKVFQKSRSMAVSPYHNIDNEYRTIVLDGEIKLIYSKQRPCIIGDGIHSIRSLIINNLLVNDSEISKINIPESNWERILDTGEHFYLNWKHNLGQGSKALLLENTDVRMKIEGIVNSVVEKMNIRFASIDIIECNNEYKVLEINSGVMMEHFSQQDELSYKIAKSIYKEAVLKMFE